MHNEKSDVPEYKDIGDRLKVIRKALGYKQLDMARLLGVSQAYYSYLENGSRSLSMDMLKTLCGFGFQADWILSGTDSYTAQDRVAVLREFDQMLPELSAGQLRFLLHVAQLLRQEGLDETIKKAVK